MILIVYLPLRVLIRNLQYFSENTTSSQSLLVIRCCGSLIPEELPEKRTQLVQEIWATLEKLSKYRTRRLTSVRVESLVQISRDVGLS